MYGREQELHLNRLVIFVPPGVMNSIENVEMLLKSIELVQLTDPIVAGQKDPPSTSRNKTIMSTPYTSPPSPRARHHPKHRNDNGNRSLGPTLRTRHFDIHILKNIFIGEPALPFAILVNTNIAYLQRTRLA